MSTLVGPKGQVVIEKAIRDELGIQPGWRAVQHIEDGRVVIYFVPPRHQRSLAGILAPHIKRDFPTTEDLRRAREEAWTLRAQEEMEETEPACKSVEEAAKPR